MISFAEPTGGFPALARQYKKLVSELLASVHVTPRIVQLPATRNARDAGMAPDATYLVKGGMLGMSCQNRKLLIWDEGDLILPDAAPDLGDAMTFHAEGAVLLAAYDTRELVRAVLATDETARLWTRVLATLQAMVLRLLAAHVGEEAQATAGFASYDAGEIIIRQGDPADYVFSLFEGAADVLVDDVVVGEVNEGEVLGAIAVLTHAPRSATVRARTRCSVVKVPKEQFTHLIRTNPTMIHGLLTDMANQIRRLNVRLVELSG